MGHPGLRCRTGTPSRLKLKACPLEPDSVGHRLLWDTHTHARVDAWSCHLDALSATSNSGLFASWLPRARHRCPWSQATFCVIRTLRINLQGGHRKAVPNPEHTNGTQTKAPPQTLTERENGRENAVGLASLTSCHRIRALNLTAGPIPPRANILCTHLESIVFRWLNNHLIGGDTQLLSATRE